MPTAIDQRLASTIHRRRIELHRRIEVFVRRLGSHYGRLRGRLLALAADPSSHLAADINADTLRVFGGGQSEIEAFFTRLARESHQVAVTGFLGTVPRKWFRVLNPRYALVERQPDEPVTDKLSQEEWEELLKEHTFPPPDAETVTRMLDHAGPGGMNWAERLRHWEEPVRDQLSAQLVQGLSAGESLADIRKRLDPLVDDVRYKAQRIARTEGRRVAELAHQEAYRQAGDLLEGQEVLATLDANTRPEHAVRHGKFYRRQSDGTFQADDGEHLPDLPDAPNCRCFPSPVLAPPEEFQKNPALAAEFRNASAEVIPDPANYSRWFDQAPESDRIASVGVRRYRAMENRTRILGRRPEWEDFLGEDGRLVPAKRLKMEGFDDWDRRRDKVRELVNGREQLVGQIRSAGLEPPRVTVPPKPKPVPKPKVTPKPKAKPRPVKAKPAPVLKATPAERIAKATGKKVELRHAATPAGEKQAKQIADEIEVCARKTAKVGPVRVDTIELIDRDHFLNPGKGAAGGYYHPRERRIQLAVRRLAKQKRGRISYGKWNVGRDIRSTARHEYGHAVFRTVKDDARREWRKLYRGKPTKEWGKLVSQYGAVDEEELFCEAFSAWTHPDYDGGLPKEIEKFFERRLGG